MKASAKFIEGYKCGYYNGSNQNNNPYKISADYTEWAHGCYFGRLDFKEGQPSQHEEGVNVL